MTVGQLKQRMTYDELRGWELYVEEMGPLSRNLRTDMAIYNSVRPFLSGTPSLRQLMTWPKEPEREATLDDFMNVLRAAKKSERKANGE